MIFYFYFLLTVIIDQASKMLIIRNMAEWQTIPLIDGIFHVTYIINPGAAFGLLPNRTNLFVVVSILVVVGIICFHKKWGTRGRVVLPLGLVAGGAFGNLIDRLRFGGVVDFIDIWIWPVFNLADAAIVIGSVLLGIYLWRAEDRGS